MCYQEGEYFVGSNIADEEGSTFYYPDVKSAEDCQTKCKEKTPDCCRTLDEECTCEKKLCRYFTFQFSPNIECNLKYVTPVKSMILKADNYIMGPKRCNADQGIYLIE